MALIKFFASVMKSPLLWGCTTCAIFYTLLHKGVINNDLIVRYFAGHPVEYFEAILFFVGLSALVIKGFDVMRQRGFTSKGLFGAVSKPDRLPSGQLPDPAWHRLRSARPLLLPS